MKDIETPVDIMGYHARSCCWGYGAIARRRNLVVAFRLPILRLAGCTSELETREFMSNTDRSPADLFFAPHERVVRHVAPLY